jgi:hypothetical protein
MIILFSLLAITVTLSAITVQDMKMSQKTKSSTAAFFNADSGVEWALNKITTTMNPGSTYISSRFTMSGNKAGCPSGFNCDVYFLKDDGTIIANPGSTYISDIKAVRSVGSQGGETQRAIEAAVAATGDYEISCANGGSSWVVCCKMKTSDGTTKCEKVDGGNLSGAWSKFINDPSW